MTEPIIQTKLHRPATPEKVVNRPDLLEKLDQGLNTGRVITLVSAPAGFGKTTCVTSWLDRLEMPAAWLALDPGDDDPGRFFLYVIAALQTVASGTASDLSRVIRSGQIPAADVISASLINSMLEIPDHFILVLDDFHTVQDDLIIQVMRELSSYQPDPLHLVLITREDPPLPLARLRANQQLTEIRARDLRFSHDNIQDFFKEVLPISLRETEIASLEKATEGWVAGLQLAGLSIKEAENPAQLISNLSGGHQYIFSYLIEQVLDHQEPNVGEFLLKTAFLDQFTAELCRAVLPDLPADEIIRYLISANLFIIPLDDQGLWFRYHHLFGDLLRSLMQKRGAEQIKSIHRDASRWYAETGMAREAIPHALAGEDYQTAIELIEDHALETVMTGNAKTVNSWLEDLPGEWRIEHSRAYLAFAWMHLLQGSFSELQNDLDALEPLLKKNWRTAEQRNTLRAEWLVIRSLLAMAHGELEQCRAYLDEAASLTMDGNLRVLSMIQYGQASVQRLSADSSAPDAYFRQAIASGQKSGNLIAEMLSTTGLATLEFEQGELNTAYAILEPVRQRLVSSSSLPPISNVIYGLLGEIHFQWCELEKAGEYFQQGYRLSVFGGLQSGIISYRLLLSRLALLSGDLEAAVLEVEKAQQSTAEEIPAYLHQEVISQQVRISLAQDRVGQAEALLTDQGFSFHPEFSYPAIMPGQRITYSRGLLYQSSLEVLLQRSREAGDRVNFQPGIDLADRILGDDYQTLPILTRIGMLLKRARMLASNGDLADSQQDYRRAVEAGSRGNLLGIFLEEGPGAVEAAIQLKNSFPANDGIRPFLLRLQEAAERLQQMSSDEAPHASDITRGKPSLAEPLTDRELEVLNAVQDGLTYQEIGSRLFISLNTVRYHIKAIYGKLNVNNRTLAIEKARQLKLI